MDKALFKKVRKIQIRTSKRVTDLFSGEYASVFKGQGMEFEEVREYQPGDEIRSIDWNVTARMNRPFIKQFREERELTVFFLVDVSSSMDFGSKGQTKRELVAEFSAALSFAATQNNDKVGALFFSDHIEKVLLPAKGKRHVLRVIREMLTVGSEKNENRRSTDLKGAFEYLGKIQRKKCVCFVISDFLQDDYLDSIKIISKKHDLIAVQAQDDLEYDFKSIGLVQVEDLETGQMKLIDFSNSKQVESFRENRQAVQDIFLKDLAFLGIDVLKLSTSKDFLPTIVRFFKEREKRASIR